jgi:hypothetical protein
VESPATDRNLFYIEKPASGGFGNDTIEYFDVGVDRIYFVGYRASDLTAIDRLLGDGMARFTFGLAVR